MLCKSDKPSIIIIITWHLPMTVSMHSCEQAIRTPYKIGCVGLACEAAQAVQSGAAVVRSGEGLRACVHEQSSVKAGRSQGRGGAGATLRA